MKPTTKEKINKYVLNSARILVFINVVIIILNMIFYDIDPSFNQVKCIMTSLIEVPRVIAVPPEMPLPLPLPIAVPIDQPVIESSFVEDNSGMETTTYNGIRGTLDILRASALSTVVSYCMFSPSFTILTEPIFLIAVTDGIVTYILEPENGEEENLNNRKFTIALYGVCLVLAILIPRG